MKFPYAPTLTDANTYFENTQKMLIILILTDHTCKIRFIYKNT